MEAPPPAPPHGLRRLATEGLLLGLLVLLSVKATYDIGRVRDLSGGDEPAYMRAGLLMREHGLPPAAYGPLYVVWYGAVSLLQSDPVRMYYLAWQLLIGLLMLGVYLLCRAAGGSRGVALFAAFLVLNSRLLDVWPYPAHLAAILLLMGTAAAARCRRWTWSLSLLGVTLLVASYARPDLTVRLLLLGLVALAGMVCSLLRRPGSWRGFVLPVVLVLLLAGAGLRWVGNPLAGGRSFVAFGQHYALNVVAARHLTVDGCMHFDSICRQDFGDAATPAEAFRANPRAMLWHCGVNLHNLPSGYRAVAEPALALRPGLHRWLLRLFVAGLVLGLLGLGRRLSGGDASPSDRHGLLVGLLMLGLVLPPALSSCLIVSPRAHYLMPSTLLLFALLMASSAHLPRLRLAWVRLDTAPALLVLGALLLAMAPNRAHGWCPQGRRWQAPPASLELQKLVKSVRALALRRDVTFLAYGSGDATALFASLPPRYVFAATKKDLGFSEFIRRHNIDLIVLGPGLEADPDYRDDPEFRQMVAGRWADRFTYLSVPATSYRLVVRKDALADCPQGKE